MPDNDVEMCHCGRRLHYVNHEARRMVEEQVAALGPTIPVTVEGRTWIVSRHYIALHGLKAWELPELGFPEVRGGGTT